MTNLKEIIKAAQLDLIKELGINQLEKSKKEEIVLQIGDILQQRVSVRIIEELPEEKQDEFKAILEEAEENPEKLEQYLKENIPNAEELVLEEIGEYKKGAVTFMKKNIGEDKIKDEMETTSVIEGLEKQKESSEPVENIEQVEKAETMEKSEKEFKKTENSNSLDFSEEEKIFNETKKPVEKIIPVEDLGDNIEKESSEDVLSKNIKQINQLENNKKDMKVENPQLNLSNDSENFFQDKTKDQVEKRQEQFKSNEDETSELEKEQLQEQAEILEENKIENKVVEGEELDLTNELEKMGDENEDKK